MSVVLKDVEELLDTKLSIELFGGLIGSLRGLSLNSDFCNELVNDYPGIIVNILGHAFDVEEVSVAALDFLINVSSHHGTISKVLNSKPYSFSEFIEIIIRILLQCDNNDVKCKAIHLLSNVTRENTSFFEEWKNSSPETIDKVFKMALLPNEEEEKLKDESICVILNLSQEISCQTFIMKNLNYLEQMLSLSEEASETWTLASIGLFKNLLKNSTFHEDLLNKTDCLVILLRPLVYLNDYEEKISNDFPEKLKKYLGTREDVSGDLRLVTLEALYLLSGTKSGRTSMRSFNVYDILKNISELDLTDDESNICIDCIGLLIRTEDEIGIDDLLTLRIPKDVQEKFTE